LYVQAETNDLVFGVLQHLPLVPELKYLSLRETLLCTGAIEHPLRELAQARPNLRIFASWQEDESTLTTDILVRKTVTIGPSI
jgi:hypothetical protein